MNNKQAEGSKLNKNIEVYRTALELKDANKNIEAIIELKRISASGLGKEGLTCNLIAMLYFHMLNDFDSALPYAEKAVEAKPKSERVSVCLFHCLFEAGFRKQAHEEIRRYIATGAEIVEYHILFEENSVSVGDFT